MDMNYVVLDLEWNQGMDKKKKDKRRNQPNFEIIEIGAVRLNSDRVIAGEFNRLIKPQIYRRLHHVAKKLIHVKMEELQKGEPFVEVMSDFLAWCGEDYIFCTWGPLDLSELQSNMQYYGMKALKDGPIRFLDVQKLFSLAYDDGKSRCALETAVDFLAIEKDIPFHRAFSDAYYAGKVLAKVPERFYRNYSYDVFHPPKSREEEVHVVFEGYAKSIFRVFPDKQAALEDKEVLTTKCYVCHKNLRKVIRWFTPNGKNYYCVAKCSNHGFMKGKLRIKKAEKNGVYVIKTTKLITQDEVEEIRLKQEHARMLRQKKKHPAEDVRQQDQGSVD